MRTWIFHSSTASTAVNLRNKRTRQRWTGLQECCDPLGGRTGYMWKRDESVRPASGQPAVPPQPAATVPAGGGVPRQEAGQNMEKDIVNIGKSVVIKGELQGS